jgi:hypothetical protein
MACMSPSISSSSEPDTGSDTSSDTSNDNEKVVEDKFDLRIKMNNWAGIPRQAHPSHLSAEQPVNQYHRYLRSRAQSPIEQQPRTMTSPPTIRNNRRQPSYILQTRRPINNASPSANFLPVRRPTAILQTQSRIQPRVGIPSTRRPHGYAEDYTCYDNGIILAEHPLRNRDHEIHVGYDNPRQSVEQAHARQERAKLRQKRQD